MDQLPSTTSPSTTEASLVRMSAPIRSLTEEINSLSLLPTPTPTPQGPPEWMLRIMRERGGQLQEGNRKCRRESKKKSKSNVYAVEESSSELDASEWKGGKGGLLGEKDKEKCEGDTPKLGGGSEDGVISERGRTGHTMERGEQKECTSRLLEACLSSASDSTIISPPPSTIYSPLEGTIDPLQYSSISPSPHHHEFSSASSNSSNASNYGGGFYSYTTASSSSGASSSGFSSAASASSVTSASSTTTFSVSSHEREREKGGGGSYSQDRSGGGGGKSRPLSAGAAELYQQQATTGSGGGPLGLGLYRSSTASPTLAPDDLTPLASYPPPLNHRYSDHSPQTFSPNPSRSSSFDILNPSSPSSSSKQSGGRDSTLLPSSSSSSSALLSPPSSLPYSSPTPSTSTLPLPPQPSIKGKEKALPLTSNEEGEDGLFYPPENFAIVAPGIFRSSFPRKKNFGFLKESLKLKSVLYVFQFVSLTVLASFELTVLYDGVCTGR